MSGDSKFRIQLATRILAHYARMESDYIPGDELSLRKLALDDGEARLPSDELACLVIQRELERGGVGARTLKAAG